MNIGIVSLGCAKNLVDTQRAMSFLKAQGHVFVDDPVLADVIIVNTCGFINPAKKESIDMLLKMAEYKKGRCRYLVAMGCLVQRYRPDLEAELPEVDLFIPISDYGRMPQVFAKLMGGEPCAGTELLLATKPWTAYLRIADGCSHRCAYCAIPLIRGDNVSLSINELTSQARQMAAIGVKELNLVAQDSTFYGYDTEHRFMLGRLLKELDTVEGLAWIRVLYMYPGEIDDGLLDDMASCRRVIPYFDIPVQHGSDRMLKLMHRPNDIAAVERLVGKIRDRFPQAILRTTMMVGFPGEQEDDFRQMLDFVSRIRWDRLGGFIYSREENTPSYDMEGQVDPLVGQQRLDRLMEMQQAIAAEKSQAMVGSTQKVLVETKDALRGIYQGRSWRNAPDDIDGHVRFTSPLYHQPGSIVDVAITAAHLYDLDGIENQAM